MNRMLLFACTATLGVAWAIVWAIDLPPIREGLWEIHMLTIDSPGQTRSESTTRLCRDHAYDKAAADLMRGMRGCTLSYEQLGPDRYQAISRCTVAGSMIDSRGVTTYSADRATHSEVHATYTPAFMGKSGETLIQDQKYLGSCPAGMRAGDRVAADGSIQHAGH